MTGAGSFQFGQRAIAWTCTLGPLGHSPFAPGTVGALCALPVAWLLRDAAWYHWTWITIAVSVVGLAAVHRYVRNRTEKDPGEVIIDELCGCLVATALVPGSFLWQGAAFLCFRLFDILKPWPISAVDRRLKTAVGVMLDDLLAGLAAGGILRIASALCGSSG